MKDEERESIRRHDMEIARQNEKRNVKLMNKDFNRNDNDNGINSTSSSSLRILKCDKTI